MYRWPLFALLFVTCMDVSMQQKKTKLGSQNLSKGWGDDINWVQTYEEGLEKIKDSEKPLMVIHHLDECPHSQALKMAFVADKNIQKMAKNDFVMLNVLQETPDVNMAPDGYYVPRILFVDPSLTVRADIVGKDRDNMYSYEPSDMALLAENMKKAKLLLHSEL